MVETRVSWLKSENNFDECQFDESIQMCNCNLGNFTNFRIYSNIFHVKKNMLRNYYSWKIAKVQFKDYGLTRKLVLCDLLKIKMKMNPTFTLFLCCIGNSDFLYITIL